MHTRDSDKFSDLASWSAERLAKWILPRITCTDIADLRALDKAAAALPEADRVVIEARIAAIFNGGAPS